jgi:hypothetical protein
MRRRPDRDTHELISPHGYAVLEFHQEDLVDEWGRRKQNVIIDRWESLRAAPPPFAGKLGLE